MQDIFISLLNMSITASYLVLAIVILRLIFRKIPKFFNVIMWALVGFRLICPFSFESVLSLIPSSETIPNDFIYSRSPGIETNLPVVDYAINTAIDATLKPDVTASTNPLQVVMFISSVIWIVGMVIMLLYTLFSFFRIKRKVKEAVRSHDNIYLCDNVATPFILGIIKPRIYLPSDIPEEEAKYVVAHEKAHIKRLDHIWKPLGFLLLTVYWYNPFLWIAYILLCRDIELACDEKVLKSMGNEIKVDYSETLLNLGVSRKSVLACPLAFGEVGVKQRVKSVLNYKKPTLWIIIIALILSVVLCLCFMTNPSHIELSETNPQLDKAISEAILDINDEDFFSGVCESEGHIVFGIDVHGNKYTVYLRTQYCTFDFEDGYFMMQSGHCIPGVFYFEKINDDYRLLDHDYVSDGSHYFPSIKKLFPYKYIDRVLRSTKKDERLLWNQCVVYAEAYLKEIGREAEIVDYGDVNHVQFTDLGISVDVLNTILGLGLPYKYEIGSFEKVEGGTRYIYKTAYLQDKNIILFTKEVYDSNEIVERIEVSSLTGEILNVSSQPIKSEYFDAKVLEVNNGTVLVEPFEGSSERKSASRIWVSTKTTSSVPPPDFYEGLYVRIVYDGMIQETYPAQINNVYAIYLYADVNYRGEDIKESETTTKAVVLE